jgi:uncharacterized protein YjbI with pentapeptide repeats
LIGVLAIPFVVVLASVYFIEQQNQASLQLNQLQHISDIQIAQDQQQETTLKTYTDDISNLVLNDHLRESKPGDDVRQIARARTLLTLQKLDPNRQAALLEYLYAAQLINRENTIISLVNADLSGVDLENAYLEKVNLSGTNLRNADLRNADLFNADMSQANLNAADLNDANLKGASITQGQLGQTKSLQETIMPDGSKHP